MPRSLVPPIPQHVIDHIEPVQQPVEDGPPDGVPVHIGDHHGQSGAKGQPLGGVLHGGILDDGGGLLGSVDQLFNGDVQNLSDFVEGLNVWLGLAILPIGHRLTGHVELLGQLVLGHLFCRAKFFDVLANHTGTFLFWGVPHYDRGEGPQMASNDLLRGGEKQKISTKKASHVEACSHGTLLGLASAAPTAPVAGFPPGTGGAPLLQGNLLSWGGIL